MNNMQKQNFILIIICLIAVTTADLTGQRTIRVTPAEIDDILINPGMGFNTFQMFNGDNLAVWIDVLNEVDLSEYGKNESHENNDHPIGSVAYFRILWRAIEPEPGKYRWDIIDGLLDIAHERNQTLMLRIAPYSARKEHDVPDWYREMVGPKRDFRDGDRVLKWVVDPEDPRYARYYGNMIRALGARYDGHPGLENMDVSIVGYAGENNGTSVLTDKTMMALLDPYIESFKKTPLVVLIHGKKANEYITSRATVGWRQDCLGDLGFWDQDPAWNHMYDYYPQTIIDYDMQDAWKKAPVTFEICGIFDTWAMTEGFNTWDLNKPYTDEQVQYIIDQSLKWHTYSFNAKSSPVPDKWKPMVDDWMRRMGYRFVLRNFKYPESVRANGKLSFESWWENQGVTPIYKDYELALRLKNSRSSVVLVTDANIREWLPGDSVFNDGVFIPFGFSPGNYELQVSIVDRQHRQPQVKLAIEGRDEEGWYTLGNIQVTK
jgi:hypothetical protein